MTEIINDKKLKITTSEFSSVIKELNDLLETAKDSQIKYSELYKESLDINWGPPTLLVEVLSGHGISLTKHKRMPFVEIIQNTQNGMCSFRNSMAPSQTTFGTDQLDSFNTSLGVVDRNTTTFQNNLVWSTPIPISPNEEGVFHWCKFFKLVYDSECIEKERSITVNLFRTKKDKNKCDQIGKSKTFFLNHIRHQKCKDVKLEYKDGYESTCGGILNLRLQYVHNERCLFKELAEKYEEQRELITQAIDSISSQFIANHPANPGSTQIEDSGHSQKAGFYSCIEDSILDTSNLESPSKERLINQGKFPDELSYEMHNMNLLGTQKFEEIKGDDGGHSVPPNY